MALFETQDHFSLRAQHYSLSTIVDNEQHSITFAIARQGTTIFSTSKSYQQSLQEQQIKQLASNFHTFYKTEIAKLFQLVKKLREKPAPDIGLELLARGFLKYGMSLETIKLLTPHLNENHEFPRAKFILGKAFLAAKKFEAAQDVFQQLLKGQRKFADTHFYLGLCKYNLRDCAAAFQAFAKAVEINSEYGEAYFYLGLTLLINVLLNQQQDLKNDLSLRAKKVFQKAMENLPELQVKSVQIGLQNIERKQYQQAYDNLAPLIQTVEKRIKPDIVNYKFRLDVLFEPQSIKPEVVWKEIQRLHRLISKFAKYPDLQYELGFAYAVLGASVSATSMTHFKKAVALNPDYKNALKGLKLIQNDQRGYQNMLRALMKV